MRIALYHNLPIGGAKRALFEMARVLKARGFLIDEITLTSAETDFIPLQFLVENQRIYSFHPNQMTSRRIPLITPYIHLLQGLKTLHRLDQLEQRIADEINAGGYDLLFAHDCMLGGNPGILRYVSIPSVFYCHHGMRPRIQLENAAQENRDLKEIYYTPARLLFESSLRAREKISCRAASLCLTNSYFSREMMLQHSGVSAKVVYLGTRIETFRPLGLPRENYVLSVGRVTYNKGQRFLIHALGTLPPDIRPELRLVADTVEQKEAHILESIAQNQDVQLSIESVLDDQRLVELYNRAKVFVYAPYLEPFGLVLLEAMACGTPVVAIREGGIREIITYGETGILVDRDPGEFGDAVLNVLKNPEYNLKLSNNAISFVKENCSWQRTGEELEKVFSNLTNYS